jgi:hypothetical protein
MSFEKSCKNSKVEKQQEKKKETTFGNIYVGINMCDNKKRIRLEIIAQFTINRK